VYQLQGRYDDAIKSLQTAIQLEPNFAEAQNRLGLTYSKLGNYQRAAECYERAAEGISDLAHAELQKEGNYTTPTVPTDGKNVLTINQDAFSRIEKFLKSNLIWSINRDNVACCAADGISRSRSGVISGIHLIYSEWREIRCTLCWVEGS
jgi:tetratricopeptide (TPR) repeat protein